jgi:hypothetical protein
VEQTPEVADREPTKEELVKADDAAAEAQSGWVTMALCIAGVAIYASLGQWHPGLINFPPLMLLCLLATGWLAPIAWRRLRR